MTWHADPETLAGYAAERLGDVASASVEAHLAGCARCRSALGPGKGVDADRHEAVWAALVDVVDRPRPGFVEGVLARLGVRPHVTRLLAGTKPLQRAWLLASAASLLLAFVAAAGGGRHLGLFLLLAPLLPLAGVAGAHAAADEPVAEVLAASPTGRFRLLMMRAVAVTVSSIALLVPASLVMSSRGLAAAAWLLPALALATATVALASWFPPGRVAGCLATLWISLAVAATWPLRPGPVAAALAGFTAFQPLGQVVCAAVALVAVAVTIDRSRFADLRTTP